MAGYSFLDTMFIITCVCLFHYLGHFTLATASFGLGTSCANVATYYAKHVGIPDIVPSSPIAGLGTLHECSHTLEHTGGLTCCTHPMERRFVHRSQDYLREHIKKSNSKLKARITQSLELYQDHLKSSLLEAQNKTSDRLESLYNIPQSLHRKMLDVLFSHLNSYLTGKDVSVEDAVDDFFAQLFPHVFKYVLSDPSRTDQFGEDFHNCLVDYHDEIKPFGKVPSSMKKRMKPAFQRARIFTETLRVMVAALTTTEQLALEENCKRALARLHLCSMCSGVVEVRPCRGLCLNVMRGCLAKVSEVSSSWDDLVIEFENLQMGMFRRNNAQEVMAYFSGNVSEALLQSMDDMSRVYDEVMNLCRETSGAKTDSQAMAYKRLSTAEQVQAPHVPALRVKSIRRDVDLLLRELDESKSFLHRVADGLCRAPVIYDQEMQSSSCWNGSAIGRYMQAVPESNIISQAKYNKAVEVSLQPDLNILAMKESLVHMRRNLSALFNEELMLSDQSYTAVMGSGYSSSSISSSSNIKDVVFDDEDYPYGTVSGSGSGSGGSLDSDETDPNVGGSETGSYTPTRNKGGSSGDSSGRCHGGKCDPDRGSSGSGGGQKSGNRDGVEDSAPALLAHMSLLVACMGLTRLLVWL